MLKAVTWCAKCLFLYFLVVVAAIRFSWIVTTPAWALASRVHWTQLTRVAFVLSYFLPIFAATGFLVGLIPFGKLGKALGDLFRSFFPSASTKLASEPDPVPPILWAWLPVTLAFLTRFVTWQSRNSSVLDPHRSALERDLGQRRRPLPERHPRNPRGEPRQMTRERKHLRAFDQVSLGSAS